MCFDRLVDSNLILICVITRHSNQFLTWPRGTCFKICFSVENIMNTVIPTTVIVELAELLDVIMNGLFTAIQCLLLFKRSVLGNAHRVLTQ